jgi:hypothetical protein
MPNVVLAVRAGARTSTASREESGGRLTSRSRSPAIRLLEPSRCGRCFSYSPAAQTAMVHHVTRRGCRSRAGVIRSSVNAMKRAPERRGFATLLHFAARGCR